MNWQLFLVTICFQKFAEYFQHGGSTIFKKIDVIIGDCTNFYSRHIAQQIFPFS